MSNLALEGKTVNKTPFLYSYDTMTEALTDLKKRGYKYDFNLHQGDFYCEVLERQYRVPQLQLKETYRFEGDSNPSDESVVYAIVADDGVMGSFVNGYGTYADTDSELVLQLVKKK